MKPLNHQKIHEISLIGGDKSTVERICMLQIIV